ARTPDSLDAVRAEVGGAAHHPVVAAALARLDMVAKEPDPAHARRIAALVARLIGAAELVRHAPPAVADLYCATRLGNGGDRVFGDLPDGYPVREIVGAVTPQVS
ncbi:MAG TPA: DNA alkylation response protein, partial [Nakamurella sp.]